MNKRIWFYLVPIYFCQRTIGLIWDHKQFISLSFWHVWNSLPLSRCLCVENGLAQRVKSRIMNIFFLIIIIPRESLPVLILGQRTWSTIWIVNIYWGCPVNKEAEHVSRIYLMLIVCECNYICVIFYHLTIIGSAD